MSKKITALIMVIATALLIGWDIYVASNDVKGDTISEIIMVLGYNWRILPLSFGVLMGHFFWNVEKRRYGKIKAIALGVIGAFVVLADIYIIYPIHPLIVMLLGIPLGRFLWPLNAPK